MSEEGVEILHTVRTIHIQTLITEALHKTQQVNGRVSSDILYAKDVGNAHEGHVRVPEVLRVAAAELRHAAAELEAEMNSCLGWEQV